MKLKPPADVTDFLREVFRGELEKIWTQIRQGEFDLMCQIAQINIRCTEMVRGGKEIVKIHIVQKGDTLWKLSKQYGVDFEQLKAANTQLSNPDMIMPGMKIKIPTGSVPVKKEAQVKQQAVKEQPIYKKETPKPPPAPPVQQPPKWEMPVVPPQMPQQPMSPPPMPQPPVQQPQQVQPSFDIHQNMYNVHLYKPQQKPMPPIQPPPVKKEQKQKKEAVKPKEKEMPQPPPPVKEQPVQPPPPPIQPEMPIQPPVQQPTYQPVQPMYYPMDQCFYPISPVMPGCANCGCPQPYGAQMVQPMYQPQAQMMPQQPQMAPFSNQMMPYDQPSYFSQPVHPSYGNEWMPAETNMMSNNQMPNNQMQMPEYREKNDYDD